MLCALILIARCKGRCRDATRDARASTAPSTEADQESGLRKDGQSSGEPCDFRCARRRLTDLRRGDSAEIFDCQDSFVSMSSDLSSSSVPRKQPFTAQGWFMVGCPSIVCVPQTPSCETFHSLLFLLPPGRRDIFAQVDFAGKGPAASGEQGAFPLQGRCSIK